MLTPRRVSLCRIPRLDSLRGVDCVSAPRPPERIAHTTFFFVEGGNTARQVMDGLWTEARGRQKQSNDPANNQHNPNRPTTGRRWRANGTSRYIRHSPGKPTTGLRERGNDTSKSTGRSGRQNAATRRNTPREERATVQGPVKEQQPDGMSHRGGGHHGEERGRGERPARVRMGAVMAMGGQIRAGLPHLFPLASASMVFDRQPVCPARQWAAHEKYVRAERVGPGGERMSLCLPRKCCVALDRACRHGSRCIVFTSQVRVRVRAERPGLPCPPSVDTGLACSLPPCPSYSRRRDRNNFVRNLI